eukprot:m.111847 g.111847  ORF g.111847 m.111847 type:complete len:56 (+) comp22797_c0_seq5:106-273(+)
MPETSITSYMSAHQSTQALFTCKLLPCLAVSVANVLLVTILGHQNLEQTNTTPIP